MDTLFIGKIIIKITILVGYFVYFINKNKSKKYTKPSQHDNCSDYKQVTKNQENKDETKNYNESKIIEEFSYENNTNSINEENSKFKKSNIKEENKGLSKNQSTKGRKIDF